MKHINILFFLLFFNLLLFAQVDIPDVYSGIYSEKNGKIYYLSNGEKFYASEKINYYTLKQMRGNPKAYSDGIAFNFGDSALEGKLYYGLIDYEHSKYPMPVWFKRTSTIQKGKAVTDIKNNLSGRYDMTGWEKKGYGTLGYRIADAEGRLLYEGVISFRYKNGKIETAETVTDGPFVNLPDSESIVISFDLNKEMPAEIIIGNKKYTDDKIQKHHEIKITDLQPDTEYGYEIKYGDLSQKYAFKTTPVKGSGKPFVFAYASDSRNGQGGGEHNLGGTNFYVMRKLAAAARLNNAAFVQFTGDMVNGYVTDKDEINLQYASWKRAIAPYAGYFPFVCAPGNHEITGMEFYGKNGRRRTTVTKFPFKTESSSAVFAQNFVNPHNGPVSEDGAVYDPDPDKTDFPPYDETVFYYIYDNVAVIVLNSDYWYAPALKYDTGTSGNLHGYIMDKQLEWLKKTLQTLEKDKDIDHIFVTQHTPVFPDGGHTGDDMWYGGNNKYRPYVNGKPLEKGIIERRDEYLNLLVNESSKVVCVLTGDEHNYNKVKITPDVNIYPDNWSKPKLKRTRTLWQINNGAAGAPYYAQDKSVPWTNAVSGFSTQNALVLIYVDGKKVSVKAINPETLDIFDEYILRN